MDDLGNRSCAASATATVNAVPARRATAIRRVGEVRFTARVDRAAACRELDRLGLLVVELDELGGAARGRLAELIDHAIEQKLGDRGAGGPGITTACDRDAALSDQLYRARRTGASGIAIVVGPLRETAGSEGALQPVDCATLRFLANASSERPLVLVLDERDAATNGYGDPIPIREVLLKFVGAGPRLVCGAGPEPAPAIATVIGAGPEPAPACAPLVGEVIGKGAESSATAPVESFAPAAASEMPAPAAAELAPLARHIAGASFVVQEEAWRAWTLQLAAARGPQPLGALEKLFCESYVPLANAIASGLDDPRARGAHDEFRNTFIKSYTEAFPTFAATTKRPRMVLDAHDAAARTARLHGARSTRLLLVDAMRWDLSRLISERVGLKLGARAALTDEFLLWSALPTTTMRQLETIARGVEALRAPAELDPETGPARGRTAEYVRRLRVGPREVHKLDLVETRMQAARGNLLRMLPEIADATADVIARHAEGLAPHTLLFVFGDHGFAIDRSGSARQGGASPEEVLVGAFALLVGDVH
jgi:hypothetical protein